MNNVYNDGQIHGWNGGDCPVHPETVVKFWLRGSESCDLDTVPAKTVTWGHYSYGWDIIAFRVVKEYVEPVRPAASKVIWVNEYTGGLHFGHDTEEKARKEGRPHATRIAVKYVEAIADAKEVKE